MTRRLVVSETPPAEAPPPEIQAVVASIADAHRLPLPLRIALAFTIDLLLFPHPIPPHRLAAAVGR